MIPVNAKDIPSSMDIYNLLILISLYYCGMFFKKSYGGISIQLWRIGGGY
jgi:hypothetical protein